jgi:5-methylcytosine-specific restriction endonuclease McrA
MLKDKIPTAVRREVFARDGHACILCGDDRVLHLHHVHTRGAGGAHTADNLVTLCPLCHAVVHGKATLQNQFPFDWETAQDAVHYYLEYS